MRRVSSTSAPDLSEQFVQAGETPGVAEPLEEIELDPVCRRGRPRIRAGGPRPCGPARRSRVRADVAGGGLGRAAAVDTGPGGVDAVGRDQGVDLDEVGGREAQARRLGRRRGRRRPGSGAAGPAGARLLDATPLRQLPADARRGDELAVDPRPLDDLEVDPRLGTPVAQDRRRSPPVVPEREVRALDHALARELLADDPIEELAGRELQQPGAGPEHADLGRAGLAQELDLAFGPDQRARAPRRAAAGRRDAGRR